MSETLELVARAIVIGAGATLLMDGWAFVLRRVGIPSLDFALLGRWLGHLAGGHVGHERIASAPPVRGERTIGWVAHYTIGITFAALLLLTAGLRWAHAPTLGPALVVGLVTVIAPLFILQPALGAGIASSKTPRPILNTLKSVVTHAVYGVGLYLAALATSPGAGAAIAVGAGALASLALALIVVARREVTR